MAGVTSVPPIEFTPAGLVVPDESAILAGVQADMNAAFGGNLNPGLSTPQGQLASSEAAIIAAKNADFVTFVNQIDPATASGFMQDAIGRIYFLDRIPAASTTVDVVCSGKTGTVIPVGALAQDSTGNIYAATGTGTIPAGGSVTVPFAAVQTGPIDCPAGAITGIYQAIFGWDSASNVVDGVTGRDVESRADFEYRRKLSVAGNANGSVQA
ncbi:MAG: baseplate J/gp47 family protein, partial [Pseudomonadota bacterium]